MGTGKSGLYKGTYGANASSDSVGNKISGFNRAGSKLVKNVKEIMVSENTKVPIESTADSVIQKKIGGKVTTERYFDSKGKAYLDVDYTNHGNANQHPIVPHQHVITYDKNGKLVRSKGEEIWKRKN